MLTLQGLFVFTCSVRGTEVEIQYIEKRFEATTGQEEGTGGGFLLRSVLLESLLTTSANHTAVR